MVDVHPFTGRWLAPEILTALTDTPVVLLHGARQTGKTTLARHIAAHHRAHFVTLDDSVALAAATQDPAGFIAGFDGPLFLDEVQRAPNLFLAIKAEVDRRRRPGRFLLTGSANIFLVPKISESLAGRIEILTLWPFSQGEIAATKDNFVDRIFDRTFKASVHAVPPADRLPGRVLSGGYPPVLDRTSPERRRSWFGSYVTTILERDIRDLSNIEGLTALPRVLALIAARTASQLNFAEMSRSLAIPQTTLKRYFTLLEATFLVTLIPAWSTNLGKRLVKTPKLFLNDTGLAAYLSGTNEQRLKADGTLRGALVENFVAMEIAKQIGWSRRRPQLFHFRTATGQEVDLVLEDNAGELAGIEVKASSTVTAQDFNGLKALAETAGKRFRRGVILYAGQSAIPFGSNLQALPISALWS